MSNPKTLHVRRFPEPLLRRVRAVAAMRGVTMREFVIAVLDRATTKEEADEPAKS